MRATSEYGSPLLGCLDLTARRRVGGAFVGLDKRRTSESLERPASSTAEMDARPTLGGGSEGRMNGGATPHIPHLPQRGPLPASASWRRAKLVAGLGIVVLVPSLEQGGDTPPVGYFSSAGPWSGRDPDRTPLHAHARFGTYRTSSPRSTCRLGRRWPPTPSHTISRHRRVGKRTHPARAKMHT